MTEQQRVFDALARRCHANASKGILVDCGRSLENAAELLRQIFHSGKKREEDPSEATSMIHGGHR